MHFDFRFIADRLASPEYNCSAHSPEEWSRVNGEPQRALGTWSIALACSSLILYIPSIRAFSRDTRHNCIKIMLFLALADMVGILCSGFLFGIQVLQGDVFCSNRIFIVATCMGGYGSWNVSSCNCIFLVLNRITELTGKEHWFKGLRGTAVMLATAAYGISVVFFIPPILTNSRLQTVLVCPMIPGFECDQYVNYVHQIHNCVVIFAVLSLFFVFCALVKSTTNKIQLSNSTKIMQTKAFTQATIICVLNVGAFFVFIVMNHVPTPQFIITIGMIGYQLINACPCMIYLVMNQNVRQELKLMLGMKTSVNKQNFSAFTATSTSVVSVVGAASSS